MGKDFGTYYVNMMYCSHNVCNVKHLYALEYNSTETSCILYTLCMNVHTALGLLQVGLTYSVCCIIFCQTMTIAMQYRV